LGAGALAPPPPPPQQERHWEAEVWARLHQRGAGAWGSTCLQEVEAAWVLQVAVEVAGVLALAWVSLGHMQRGKPPSARFQS